MLRRPPRPTLFPYTPLFRSIQLLQDGDPDRATQFADPALARVSAPALEFLARLRTKNPRAADERYAAMVTRAGARSEEHTSELQSRQYLVCRLLLEKNKNRQ